MSAGFTQWESDPLFSAAEVVQDSADRMESIFRILLHEQSLFQGDSSDQKLLNSIEYHTRDLATALGTTKWQLEDFERAVDLSALSDNSRVKEGIIFRHKQFIRAIREQIIHVERGLEGPSSGVPEGNSQWLNLNDNDREGLVLFLTGGKFMDHAQSESGNSIMRRFLDPTKASTYDSQRDEIIELKTEEIEDSQVNSVMHISHSFDNSTENKLRKVGSSYNTRLGYETSVPIKVLTGNDELGSWDLENCDSNAKSFFSKNKLRGPHNRSAIFGLLGELWSGHGSKIWKSFTKRTKDGEWRTDFDQKPSSSYFDLSPAKQGRHSCLGLSSGSCDVFKNTMQSCRVLAEYKKAFQRLWYIIQFNRFPVQIATLILILAVLGILMYRVAW